MCSCSYPRSDAAPRSPCIGIDPGGLAGSLLGISPVLTRVHQRSRLSERGRALHTPLQIIRDAQRVAFVPDKPPLLHYLDVPLRSSIGTPPTLSAPPRSDWMEPLEAV
ncbi:hypothetical protein F2P81_024264 [Scophthalmus maximus]|uniref:Uncharacterized protein n=1 Tax=Scophthalmus maximus TaxID=52904 RepID=A0A6A4RYZ2_SCOMX|nr:hypothetical protein F2P81_024264 [Scophthalmus maximus]